MQFTAMWISFLIIGSLEVVSQILVYFFWPIYVLVGYQWLVGDPVSIGSVDPSGAAPGSRTSGERRCPDCLS